MRKEKRLRLADVLNRHTTELFNGFCWLQVGAGSPRVRRKDIQVRGIDDMAFLSLDIFLQIMTAGQAIPRGYPIITTGLLPRI